MRLRDGRLAQEAHRLRLQIAIDGPAGAGKSTVGRGLAVALGCAFLDTGLMYRAITWLALELGIAVDDVSSLERLAESTSFELSSDGETLLVNGEPRGDDLRTREVDLSVSTVSSHPAVRRQMVRRQRQLADHRCMVMIGRDIGTVVLPDAPVKIWVTAPPRERARRRLAEDLPGSEQTTEDEMVEEIEARDALDAGRTVAPLKRARDAVAIATDGRTAGESLSEALDLVRHALGQAVQQLTDGRSGAAGRATEGGGQ